MASGGLFVPSAPSKTLHRWAASPTVRYADSTGYEYYVKHLFPPGSSTALCGVVCGPGWGKPRKDGLRCEKCDDLEEQP